MAEDLTSREILEQLVERLDHLESLLQAHTARLHAIERRVGIEPLLPTRQSRTPHETRAGERVEARAPQVEAPATTKIEAPAAETSTQTPPSEPQPNEQQPHTWSLPSQTTEAGKPDTHSWMAETEVARVGVGTTGGEARASATREKKRRDI